MAKTSPIILLTDFGTSEPYVAAMKGVIASVTSGINCIDMTHHIHPQNIRHGAFLLFQNYKFFPKDSVFLCVVDPGVGSERKAIAIRTKNYFFVGPDNGLMHQAASDDGVIWIRDLKNKHYWRTPKPSKTFHGRDIFAPIAAHLSVKKFSYQKIGPVIGEMQAIDLPKPKKSLRRISGEVMMIDQFGNAITNIMRSDLLADKRVASVEIKKKKINGMMTTYASKKKGLGAIINSNNYVEITYPNGSAEKHARIKVGDAVHVRLA